MEKKEVWSTSGIIANRNNWSLAADVELLKHLQALSEKIFTKASSTLHSLNSFENDVNQTCISIANTSNKFKSLSDTQFIESKVQEESADISEPSYSQTEQPPADRENENITVKLKEALENGFRVLDTQYDLIPVSGSDSEDDEPEEILLRARNPYLSRRLPHIIGSEEFTRNDNLGLIDSSSSEEEEEEEEEEDDDTDDDRDEERKKVRVDSDEESITVQKPPPLKTEFIRPRTEIIRISSSDSEDSEESIPCDRKQAEIISESKNKLSEKSKDDEPEKNPNSFAEHLSAALNSRNISSIDPPDFEGSFSPPPFPGKDNSISSEDESDDSSDIFATKKNTKQSVSNINYKPNHENESDVDNDWDTNKIGVLSKEPDALRKPLESSRKSSIVSKTSQYSTSSNSSSMGNEVQKKNLSVTGDQFDSQPMPKSKISESNINSINKRMVSAINSELSAKLNLKNSTAESKERLSSTKISSESSENRIPDVSSNKSSKNNTPAKTTSPKATYEQNTSSASKRSSQKPALFNQLDGKSSSEEDNEDDLFRTVKKAKSKKEKSKGLFDDNGNIENLFSPLKSTSKSTTKTNDSFSSKPNEPTKSDKIASDSDSKPPVVDLFKKSDLFASDSDSEDDIFSIIKNKKKPANDIFSTKIESDSNDFKRTPISSNDTQSTKTSTISPTAKSAPAESKSQSLLTENKSANDFNSSVKSAESAKKNVNEKKDVINVTSSENRLFDDVKTAGDLFQSDDYDDLFSKTIESADNRTSVRENANMSKSEVQSSTVSFADTVENSNVVKEKSASEISSNIHRSSASESTNRTENLSTSNMENTAQSDKKGNIFAKIQPSKYSSSSEDEMENSKNENSATNLFGAPLRNKSEESNTDETSKKGTKSNDETVPTRKEDLFEENDNASGFNIDFKTKADDNFGESYESRSAMFLPPKDDFLEGFSEDEDIKDNNYLSQDDDDLFSEKFEPPPFQQPIPDDDIFGEKYSTKSPPESQKNIVIDATPAEDLFAKSSSALSSTDLFHENDIFGEKRSTKSPPESRKNDVIDASPDEDLFSKSSTALSSTDLFQGSDTFSEPNDILEKDPKLPDNQARSENKEIEKNDTDQKLLQNNEEKKDDDFDKPKESVLFNIGGKKLLDSDSDEFSPISEEKINPVSLTAEVDQSKNSEQTTSKKASSPDGFSFFKDKIENPSENLPKTSVDEKPSSNIKVGKINTDMFEKSSTEKKLDEDVQDGNIFVKSTSPESISSSRNIPGKLAMNRGLNINVSALLPGSNWSSKMKQKQDIEPVTPDEKLNVEPVTPKKSEDLFEQSTDTLSNVIKERPKASGKRRPPSRQARKSRIVSDIFGDGFGTELPPEENDSNVHLGSPKLPEKAKIEKSEILEDDFTSKNVLFGNEDKIDDLFGITTSQDEFNIKQPVSDSQTLNVSLPEAGSDFDVKSSLNRLPGLTKNRAKPQKRSPPLKTATSDIPPVTLDKDITSSKEVKSKSVAKNLNTSSDEKLIAENRSKPTPLSIKTLAPKSIFDSLEDDDDDLFENMKSKKTAEEKSVPKVESKIESKPLPEPSPLSAASKSKTNENAKINIFDDDDDDDQLFSLSKKKLSTSKLTKKNSLFEDNDDDDLFGTKSSMSSSRKTSGAAVSSTKSKVQNEKPRVVKLRSETVQKDPLTGKDLGGPL